MTTTYRSIFAPSHPDLVGHGRALFVGWLASKGIPGDLPAGGSLECPIDGGIATRICNEASEGPVRALRLRLDEELGAVRWSTVLVLMVGPGEQWAWIDLERVSDDVYGRPPSIAVPRLVGDFLRASPCRAGSTTLLADARIINEAGVPELVEELVAPTRTVPIVVVSKDRTEPDAGRRRGAALARALMGVANVWVLEGLATSALSQAIGESLHVYGGAVRTYFPGLSLPDVFPGRHRFAGRDMFTPNLSRGIQVVARGIVGRAVGGRPPTLFRTTVARLPGFTRQGGDAESILADLVRVEDERDQLKDDLEWAILEAEEAQDQAEQARARVRWLEEQLAEHHQFVAGVETPATLPLTAASCGEALLLAAEYLRRVDVGNTAPEPADALDEHQKAGTWGRKAWQALRALESYAQAKARGAWTGNFLSFCQGPPTGCEAVPAEWVATGESETTDNNPRFREARTFPVPVAVDPGGRSYMDQHIKLEKGSDPAPRMHFCDETGGPTGKVYVGYLGRHLPSLQTN